MKRPDFWKNRVFPNTPVECVWHVVVPTMLVVTLEDWSKVEKQLKGQHDALKIQRESMNCVICGTFLAGKEHIFAFRILISKTIGPDDSILFTPFFHAASICFDCGKKAECSSVRIPANCDTIPFVIKALEDAFASIEFVPSSELTPLYIWELTKKEFDLQDKTLWKNMGKFYKRCEKCRSPNPKNRCSGCHFIRYCSRECSVADWEKHKPDCKFFKETSLFCYKTIILMDH